MNEYVKDLEQLLALDIKMLEYPEILQQRMKLKEIKQKINEIDLQLWKQAHRRKK